MPGPSSRTSIAPGRGDERDARRRRSAARSRSGRRACARGRRGRSGPAARARRRARRRGRRSARPPRGRRRRGRPPRRGRRPRRPGRAAAARRPSRTRRSTSASAASISSRSPVARASSRRRRMPLSGVRSWCEASATNSRWPATSRSSRAAISLNVRARPCCSAEPSTGTRVERSPWPRRAAAASRRPQRAARSGARSARRRRARAAARARRPRSSPRIEVRVARRTASTLWVMRTAPSGRPALRTGTAVARISASSVSERRSSWTGVAAQGRGDLGAAGVRRAELGGAVGVGDEDAVGVGDDHAPARGLRDGADDPAQLGLAAELARRGGGGDLGLVERLRADLGVDAVAQVERERHLERDDRQQQHVGQRQQQSGAEAYCCSSGARKRKPTPRTVCR